MNPATLSSRRLRRGIAQERVIVTGGPASAPIDAMRVLTNRSTGELGVLLANALVATGASVDGWIGESASSRMERDERVQWGSFSTNDDLLRCFEALANDGTKIAAIFHGAALSDFAVVRAERPDGSIIEEGKISSAEAEVRLILEPEPKLLSRLREWFPDAYLCGWKFEAGAPEAARLAVQNQMQFCRTDSCILNGPTINGFEWHQTNGCFVEVQDRATLAHVLADAFSAGTSMGPSLHA
jgi:phosphopantothenoylcysteine synthetase/decarboxylase